MPVSVASANQQWCSCSFPMCGRSLRNGRSCFFKCDAVKYHSSRCRDSHWDEHKNSCTAYRIWQLARTCSRCGLRRIDFNSKAMPKCSQCNYVRYCGTDCQAQDWSSHRHSCLRNVRRRLNAEDPAPMDDGSSSHSDVDHENNGLGNVAGSMDVVEEHDVIAVIETDDTENANSPIIIDFTHIT